MVGWAALVYGKLRWALGYDVVGVVGWSRVDGIGDVC